MLKKTPLKAKAPLKTKTAVKQATKKIAKPKQHTISWYKKEADKWFSLATRYRFAEKMGAEWFCECITCGIKKHIKFIQCGHFMSRSYNSTRYDELNTAPQCYGCNVMHQGRQYEFGMALDDLYGAGTAKRMHDLAKQPKQFKKEELIEIINDSKEQILYYEKQ